MLAANEYQASTTGETYASVRIGGVGPHNVARARPVKLRHVGDEIHVRGEIYGWHHSRLHGPDRADLGTVTVVLQGRHIVDGSDIFLPRIHQGRSLRTTTSYPVLKYETTCSTLLN